MNTIGWKDRIDDAESENCAEHRRHIRPGAVCVDDWVILRAVDFDGVWRGGLWTDGKCRKN